jgi:hypothetical protein
MTSKQNQRLALLGAVMLLKKVEFALKEEKSLEGGVTDVTFATKNLGLGIFEQDLQENPPDQVKSSI